MKVNLHTPIEETQIQILPLIDVVFCILTFFLLAALQFTRQQAINIDLPKAATSTLAGGVTSQSATQIVTIDAVGNLYIEKQPVQRDQLAQNLSQYLQANPSGTLVLNASRTATYNDVVEILDLMRQVGGDRVSLGIIPGPTQLPNNSFNPPNFPMSPGGLPAPVPGVNPDMVSPVLPNEAAPQVPVAPETTPAPSR
ncbi:biopolymer transporter ExbD [Nodularia spumigena CS-584]|jgi:biopolymer transport protein ExbD|uniref:Biopolymer transport protein ExbD n=4 Tax=Nodularia spumigena TaxID=70799 RepID=A0A2S0Q687_NODSP|nr:MULTISPECIES: biopolymer transporter ExbD [Cyanophyceae]MDB9357774.1 biopolymer transporter ExbD [Nodularia spumigena CS-587/03]AHJ29914.1 Biopolymer transport protein ExbD/TolR [Nodularia spumigena CCY9414]AVZ29897.1 biopolymer transport protein ExbD [Nodularia spumigena UHCC 0039]EAW45569.1 Biopolymer transport protein ExbD/TolR [Nodularia spumigena CCY9414]KZL50164.1 biopolymer transporter ExbD [Nodularia spumigena CENA596]